MSEPELTARSGPAPTELIINNLTVGDDKEATPNTRVGVRYVGVDYETGEKFDSSRNRGQSIEFPLNGLIAGQQEDVPDTKVGGRHKLICPPEKAYGPAGAGHLLSGKTLVFVTDPLDIK